MTRVVRWLGHATALIEIGGVRLLTDPLLRPRLAHITRRVPAIAPDTLGPIDAVLISHVHLDHLDRPTLRRLGSGVPIIAPRGAAAALRGLGPVRELAVGEATEVRGVAITATHAVHTARHHGRRVPALGYVIDGDVYFAGDTDIFDAMGDLAPLALALLPVWGYGPTLGPGHLDPPRAAEATALLRPRVAIPIHWGTYFPWPLGLGGHRLLREPPLTYAARAAELAPGTEVVVLPLGGATPIPDRYGGPRRA
jgi:L-ascorbate metabolism protein UlaG (beta-lactamase superfamily)